MSAAVEFRVVNSVDGIRLDRPSRASDSASGLPRKIPAKPLRSAFIRLTPRRLPIRVKRGQFFICARNDAAVT